MTTGKEFKNPLSWFRPDAIVLNFLTDCNSVATLKGLTTVCTWCWDVTCVTINDIILESNITDNDIISFVWSLQNHFCEAQSEAFSLSNCHLTLFTWLYFTRIPFKVMFWASSAASVPLLDHDLKCAYHIKTNYGFTSSRILFDWYENVVPICFCLEYVSHLAAREDGCIKIQMLSQLRGVFFKLDDRTTTYSFS